MRDKNTSTPIESHLSYKREAFIQQVDAKTVISRHPVRPPMKQELNGSGIVDAFQPAVEAGRRHAKVIVPGRIQVKRDFYAPESLSNVRSANNNASELEEDMFLKSANGGVCRDQLKEDPTFQSILDDLFDGVSVGDVGKFCNEVIEKEIAQSYKDSVLQQTSANCSDHSGDYDYLCEKDDYEFCLEEKAQTAIGRRCSSPQYHHKQQNDSFLYPYEELLIGDSRETTSPDCDSTMLLDDSYYSYERNNVFEHNSSVGAEVVIGSDEHYNLTF